MRLGDVIESAIWLSGEESPEHFKRYKADVRYAVESVCVSEGWEHGPVTFVEKKPGDAEVPQVPDHIQGPNVRMLVAEAEITGRKVESKPDSFVANLDRKDLARLRKITREAHVKMNGDHSSVHTGSAAATFPLSDRECDEIIEEIGPEAAVDALRRTVTLH